MFLKRIFVSVFCSITVVSICCVVENGNVIAMSRQTRVQQRIQQRTEPQQGGTLVGTGGVNNSEVNDITVNDTEVNEADDAVRSGFDVQENLTDSKENTAKNNAEENQSEQIDIEENKTEKNNADAQEKSDETGLSEDVNVDSAENILVPDAPVLFDENELNGSSATESSENVEENNAENNVETAKTETEETEITETESGNSESAGEENVSGFFNPQQINENTERETESESVVENSSFGKKTPVHSDSGPKALNAGFLESQKTLEYMYLDVRDVLKSRGGLEKYGMWKRYADSILRRYNSTVTGNELNNRFRLSWFEHLYRDPLTSIFETEVFSRNTFNFMNGNGSAKKVIFDDIRKKMDVPASVQPKLDFSTPDSPEKALEILKTALVRIVQAQAQSVAPLQPAEKVTLVKELNSVFSEQMRTGHTIPSEVTRQRSKYLLDLLRKMDKGAVYDAVDQLLPLTDADFIAQLAKLSEDAVETKALMNGKVVQVITTPVGDIIIGGRENNSYDLDLLTNVVCVIDLGGDDTYRDGICNLERPVFLLFDLNEGNDVFTSTKPGVQGGSILGISLLYNQKGNDIYKAKEVSQGSTIGGAGFLIDADGNDQYTGLKRAQGTAIAGIGILLDQGGDDDYRCALFGQGLGHPGGFALLCDTKGNDHYFLGGLYPDSYPENPGYDGWGQGVGSGIRQVASGGIGVMLDGDGDDIYEFDYFAHGGGYWMGLGVARDFGGNDNRVGYTTQMFDGSRRQEGIWQRFGCGFGCHYALGYLMDDFGDDSYNGTIMGIGMAWDMGFGALCDFNGNDIYKKTGGLTQGTGAQGSIGLLFDRRGDDQYQNTGQGYAGSQFSYHSPSNCGSNFSIVVDHGGKDIYGSRAQNNALTQRGLSTGFIIDRPTKEEMAELENLRQESLRQGDGNKSGEKNVAGNNTGQSVGQKTGQNVSMPTIGTAGTPVVIPNSRGGYPQDNYQYNPASGGNDNQRRRGPLGGLFGW